jgi:TolB-like protein
VIGTPQYMAPEQITGDPVTERSDLFAVGSMLFEMLAGRPAFAGRSVIEVLHATVTDQPPALTGSSSVAAIDRVIRRALAKRPADRPESAEALADDLRTIPIGTSDETPTLARPLTRIVVLPFRALRPDPDTDFLAFGLPDAIATSLAGSPSLIVRSTAKAARFSGDAPDLQAIATEADVDRVVMGTLLRSGDQLRVTTQLVEAPGGTLLTTHTAQSSMGELFRLQDDLARSVVTALALPLGGGTTSLRPDVPHDAHAYELYLRANEAARTYAGMTKARDLYRQCLERDPTFAPAWAQLGRCHRVLGKYVDGAPASEVRAQEALNRALELNPRLTIAHKFLSQLEADTGQARNGVVRLLAEATHHGNDPELFAGLVHVCRYCGLFDESIAAHNEARRLDPNVATSYEQTLMMTGDLQTLLDQAVPSIIAGADDGIRMMSLGLAGRRDEARAALLEMRRRPNVPAFEMWADYLLAWIDRRPRDMVLWLADLPPLKIQEDPEAWFTQGWLLCDAGDYDQGLEFLRRAVSKGYSVAPTLRNARHFDALRSVPKFQKLLAEAEAGRDLALNAFEQAGGYHLLGAARVR